MILEAFSRLNDSMILAGSSLLFFGWLGFFVWLVLVFWFVFGWVFFWQKIVTVKTKVTEQLPQRVTTRKLVSVLSFSVY